MKAGIIGIGKMGLLHMSIMSSMPDVEVIAICDKSKMIKQFAEKALKNFTVTNSVEELRDLNLDLVYITTPIPSHFKIIESVYTNTIAPNIFVEKTLASSLAEAEKICSYSDACNGLNVVGYERRFAVTFNRALKLILQSAIGEIISFKAYAYSSDFLGPFTEKAAKAATARGGLLRDLCSHAIDLSIWFFGNLKVVSKSENKKSGSNFIDSLSLDVCGERISGVIEASWSKKGYRLPEIGLEIIGSSGILTVNDDQLSIKKSDGSLTKLYRLDLQDNVDFLLGAPEYYRESRNFVDCIIKGKTAEPNFKTSLKVENIIEQFKQV